MSMYQEFIDRNLGRFIEQQTANDELQAGWVGAGAGVAKWWLESDRSCEADEVMDVTCAQMIGFMQANFPDYVVADARAFFRLGFYWLLAFETPSEGTSVH